MTKKGIQRDMLFYMPAKILEGLIGIVAISVYSKLLSPAEYGRYGLINPLILITFTLVSGWIYHSVYRFSNDESYKPSALMSTLTLMLLISQGVAFFIMLAAKTYFGYDISGFVLLMLYVAYSTFQILSAFMVSRRYVISANLIALGAIVIKLSAMVLIYTFGVRNYMAILLGNFTADTLLSVVMVLILKLKLSFKDLTLAPVRTFISFGYPLIGLSLTMMIMSLSDRFIIKYFYSATEVGIYTANYSVASAAFTLLTVGLMRAVYPNILAQFKQGNLASTERLLSQSIRLYTLIAVPAAFGLWMISKGISSFILDTAYTEGALVIGYVAFGMSFLGLSEYASKSFELMKQTNQIFFISLLGAVLNIVLNYIYVPIYGYPVAALTTTAAYGFHTILMFYFGSKRIPLRFDIKATLAVFASAIAMTLCGFWMLSHVGSKLALILVIFASAVVYFIGIWLSGTYKNELKLFKDLLGGRKHAGQ